MSKRFPIYSRLLRLYPQPYRDRYGSQMLQTLADMLDDTDNSRIAVWARTVLDFPLNVTRQNVIYAGGIMTQQTPDYMKRNALISAALLLPFFALIVVNSLSSHALDVANSWKQLFVILLIGLPALALLLSIVTFLKWSRQRHSFWKSLFDVRRNWLILIPGGLALLIVLFVPFHDSTHCVTGNPVTELQHFNQTVQCIEHSK